MTFRQQIIATLIGTFSGFGFGLALFYITSKLEKRRKRRQLVKDLLKEAKCSLLHYLRQAASIHGLISSNRYELLKTLPFDILFRVKKSFQEKSFEDGVIYELLSETEIFDLISAESNIMYEDQEIKAGNYRLKGGTQEEAVKHHRDSLQTRMTYCHSLRNLCRQCMLFLEPKRKRTTVQQGKSNTDAALGEIFCQMGDYESALHAFEEALKTNPKDASIWVNKGVALAKLGFYEEAIIAENKATMIDPQNASAWANKASVFSDMGRHDEALIACDKALERDSQNAVALANRGTALDALGRREEALNCLEEAIKVNPKAADLWFNKGSVLLSHGSRDDALIALDKAIEIDPRHAGALTNKGTAIGQTGHHQEAVVIFEKAIEANPRFASAWGNKGISLIHLGRNEEALAALDRAIELAPQHANTFYSRACLYALEGSRQKALSDLESAIAIDPLYIEKAKEDEDFVSLRDDKEFRDILSRTRLKSVWRRGEKSTSCRAH